MSDLHKRFPFYSKLLKLYPSEYQKQYGDQLLQTTADMLDDTSNSAKKKVIWVRVAFNLPVNVVQSQLQYEGSIMWSETPHYIKRNSMIGTLLLLPFVAALVANSLDKVINNHDLYNSWLWKTPVIQLWVLWLPEIAFALIAGTYLYFILNKKKTKRISFLKRLTDIRHYWPVIVPGVLAFGVLFILAFHDSGQCWVHNPSYMVDHLSQEWQCSTRNQSLRGFRRNF
jgi:hypothetical protein